MARHSVVVGLDNVATTVAFTSEEETEADAVEAAWEADAIPRAAMSELMRLEGLETPRRMAEAQLTDEGKAWLQANRDAIAVERAKL